MAVSLSGVLLSSLFFDQSNSKGDQEGFLLGQVVSHITDTISDSQLNNIKEEHTISINSFLPCKGLYSFYTSAGGISEEKLAKILLGRDKDVVGWYKFRRNSSLQVSMREKVVHQKLQNLFPGLRATHFLFGLFTTTATTNTSTHNFEHIFFQSTNGAFKGIPVQIVNLGDAVQSQYKVSSKCGKGQEGATMYGGIIQQYGPMFTDESGEIGQVFQIRELNSTMHRKLKNLCHGIIQSEEEVEALVKEVEHLQYRTKDREKHIEKTESLMDFKSASGAPKSSVSSTRSVPIEMDKTLLVGRATTPTESQPTQPQTLPSKPKKVDPFNFVDDLLKIHKESGPSKKSSVAKSCSLPRQMRSETNSSYEKLKTNSLKVSSSSRNQNGVSGDGADSSSQNSSDDFEKGASPMYVDCDEDSGSMSPVF